MRLRVTCERCLWMHRLERHFEYPETFQMRCHKCEELLTVRVTAKTLFAPAWPKIVRKVKV